MFKNTFPNPGSIYLFKVNSRNIRKRSDICSKLPMKIPKRRHWGRSGVFIISYFKTFPKFSIVDFEQVNICWENFLTFYSSDTSFNVSTWGRQDLTMQGLAMQGIPVIFLIFHTQWDVTFASLRLLKWFIQWKLESLYKCDHQILGTQK